MSFLEGTVGPQYLSDGATAAARLGKTKEIIIGDAHARYHEATTRGNVFLAGLPAGVSLGTALTATAVTLTLYNPIGSGVLLALLNVTLGVTAAPAGNAVIVLATNFNPLAGAPTATTLAAMRCAKLGPAIGRGVAYTAATLPAVPSVSRILGSIFATGSTAALVMSDDVAGAIILPENTAVTIQGIGVAASGMATMTWEEVPA